MSDRRPNIIHPRTSCPEKHRSFFGLNIFLVLTHAKILPRSRRHCCEVEKINLTLFKRTQSQTQRLPGHHHRQHFCISKGASRERERKSLKIKTNLPKSARQLFSSFRKEWAVITEMTKNVCPRLRERGITQPSNLSKILENLWHTNFVYQCRRGESHLFTPSWPDDASDGVFFVAFPQPDFQNFNCNLG